MLPAIGDIEYVNKKARLLKTQIGAEKFNNFIKDFGKNFKNELEELFEDIEYQESSAEQQKRAIEKIKNGIIKELLEEYNFIEPEKTK